MNFIRSILTEVDMSQALSERRADLEMLQEEVEHAVNLTHGHLGKIEAGDKKWGKRPFRINQKAVAGDDQQSPVNVTPTLMWLMEHYKLKLLLVDEETARQVMPVDNQSTIRQHRNKETREIYPNETRFTLSLRVRPGDASDTCGGFSPASTSYDLPSTPSTPPSPVPPKTGSRETPSSKPLGIPPMIHVCNICGYPSAPISYVQSIRRLPST